LPQRRGKVDLPMKKTIRKLVVRSETLRALDNGNLTRAVGGSVVPLRESGDKQCAQAVVITAACG
jgi:hypothetical protein